MERVPIPRYTAEEKRASHERWLAARLAELHAYHEKYAGLERHIRALARHLNVDLRDR